MSKNVVIFDQGLKEWLEIRPRGLSSGSRHFNYRECCLQKQGGLKCKINPESGLESLEFRVQTLSISSFYQLAGSLSCLSHSPLGFTSASAPSTTEFFLSPSASWHWVGNFSAILWASDSFHERDTPCASYYFL